MKKSAVFKELTPRSRTYELRSQGGGGGTNKIKDKQIPHTVLHLTLYYKNYLQKP